MSDTPTTDTPLETTAAQPTELPEGWGQALLDRFGTSDAEPGLTEYEGGVGIDAGRQLGASPPTPAEPVEPAILDAESATPDAEPAPTEPPAPAEPAAPPAPADAAADASTPQEPSAAPGGWDHHYLDETTQAAAVQHFTDDEVRDGLMLRGWRDSLSPEMRQALFVVESGQAVPVPRADYERFVAWSNAQSTQQRDADLSQYDDDAAAVIRQQRDQIAQLQAQQPAAPQVDQSLVNANLSSWAMQTDQAAAAWAQARHLSVDEARPLWRQVVDSGMLSSLAASRSQYSPTGQFLAPADPRAVAYELLDFQLSRDQALLATVHQRHAAANPAPAPASAPAAAPPATAPPANAASIEAKKARAASVSAAPSAAVTPAPRAPLVGQDAVAAMAAELAPVMNGG